MAEPSDSWGKKERLAGRIDDREQRRFPWTGPVRVVDSAQLSLAIGSRSYPCLLWEKWERRAEGGKVVGVFSAPMVLREWYALSRDRSTWIRSLDTSFWTRVCPVVGTVVTRVKSPTEIYSDYPEYSLLRCPSAKINRRIPQRARVGRTTRKETPRESIESNGYDVFGDSERLQSLANASAQKEATCLFAGRSRMREIPFRKLSSSSVRMNHSCPERPALITAAGGRTDRDGMRDGSGNVAEVDCFAFTTGTKFIADRSSMGINWDTEDGFLKAVESITNGTAEDASNYRAVRAKLQQSAQALLRRPHSVSGYLLCDVANSQTEADVYKILATPPRNYYLRPVVVPRNALFLFVLEAPRMQGNIGIGSSCTTVDSTSKDLPAPSSISSTSETISVARPVAYKPFRETKKSAARTKARLNEASEEDEENAKGGKVEFPLKFLDFELGRPLSRGPLGRLHLGGQRRSDLGNCPSTVSEEDPGNLAVNDNGEQSGSLATSGCRREATLASLALVALVSALGFEHTHTCYNGRCRTAEPRGGAGNGCEVLPPGRLADGEVQPKHQVDLQESPRRSKAQISWERPWVMRWALNMTKCGGMGKRVHGGKDIQRRLRLIGGQFS
ncbi:hypothetical protein WN48_05086 [Eufriesea mexicana]|nr:hypothetical protein WN48_05086 [Eufriesea mexicana]